MSVDAVRSSFVVGGYQDTCDFNTREEWLIVGLVPGFNTISGSVRLVCNVALALFNTLKSVIYTACGIGQWMFSVETTAFDHANDSMYAIGFSVGACAYAVFEAIPVVGNIPYWCFMAVFCIACRKFGEASKKPFFGFFEPPGTDPVPNS